MARASLTCFVFISTLSINLISASLLQVTTYVNDIISYNKQTEASAIDCTHPLSHRPSFSNPPLSPSSGSQQQLTYA